MVEFTRVRFFGFSFLFTLKLANQFSSIFPTVNMFAESVCELPLIQKCGEIALEKKQMKHSF